MACILSRNAWFSFFEEALASIDERVRALPQLRAPPSPPPRASLGDELPAEGDLGRFMRELCARPTPAPGAVVVVPFPWHEPGTAYPSQIELAAPTAGGPNGSNGNASNPDVKFASLLRQPGGTYAVVSLFAALLMERRVVISGSDLRRVSQAVVAANAAMYPLAWQHIYLPLMPRAFVDYLTAPMPFLVGLHSSLVPEMRALPTEDIFHLDLDGGECSHFPEDLDSMPTRTTQTLQSALKKALSGGGRHAPHEGSDGDPSGGSMNAFTAGPQLDAPVDDAPPPPRFEDSFRRRWDRTGVTSSRTAVGPATGAHDRRITSAPTVCGSTTRVWRARAHEAHRRVAATDAGRAVFRGFREGASTRSPARSRLARRCSTRTWTLTPRWTTTRRCTTPCVRARRARRRRRRPAASYGYKKSAEYYSSFVKSSYDTAYYNKNAGASASTPSARGGAEARRGAGVGAGDGGVSVPARRRDRL